MPDLSITMSQFLGNADIPAASWRLWATMLWPKDAAAQERHVEALAARWMADNAEAWVSPECRTDLGAFGRALADAPRAAELLDDHKRQYQNGCAAGEILRRILLRARQDRSSVSLYGVFREVSEEQRGRPFFERRRQSSYSYLTKRWETEFMPVAHLWAVYVDLRVTGPAMPDPFPPVRLADFLAEAEAIRREAEGLRLGHSPAMVLDRRKTFKVPADVAALLPVNFPTANGEDGA